MTEYTDAQKWFLITTDLDGTLLCDIFHRTFDVDMTEQKNKKLFKEMKLYKLKANPDGWLHERKPILSTINV
jgi:hypothetical protein